jgi:hypothetical protein
MVVKQGPSLQRKVGYAVGAIAASIALVHFLEGGSFFRQETSTWTEGEWEEVVEKAWMGLVETRHVVWTEKEHFKTLTEPDLVYIASIVAKGVLLGSALSLAGSYWTASARTEPEKAQRAEGAGSEILLEGGGLPEKGSDASLLRPNSNTWDQVRKSIQGSLKEDGGQLWVAAGAVAGIVAGAASNIARTGSLLGYTGTCSSWSHQEGLLQELNWLREHDLKSREFPLFTPGFTPFLLVPSVICSIWNTLKPGRHAGSKGKGLLERLWSQLSSNVLYPSVHSFTTVGGTLFLRFCLWNRQFKKLGVDVSGHAAIQTAMSLNIAQTIQAIGQQGTGMQKRGFSLLASAIAVTDAVWMYNTTANCHSVADVVSAVALVAIVHISLLGVESVIAKGCAQAKSAFAKRTGICA